MTTKKAAITRLQTARKNPDHPLGKLAKHCSDGEPIAGMTTKHTPGPWAFSLNEGHTAHEIWSTYGPERGISFVANVAAKSDARLIAAAPEMLAALLKCHAQLANSEQELQESGDWGDDEQDTLEMLSAAIDKARA